MFSLKSFFHVFAFFNLSITALNMLLAYHVKSKAGISLTDKNSRLFMYRRLYGELLVQKHTTGGYSVWGSIIKC